MSFCWFYELKYYRETKVSFAECENNRENQFKGFSRNLIVYIFNNFIVDIYQWMAILGRFCFYSFFSFFLQNFLRNWQYCKQNCKIEGRLLGIPFHDWNNKSFVKLNEFRPFKLLQNADTLTRFDNFYSDHFPLPGIVLFLSYSWPRCWILLRKYSGEAIVSMRRMTTPQQSTFPVFLISI